jgi:hypothetical protein
MALLIWLLWRTSTFGNGKHYPERCALELVYQFKEDDHGSQW